MTRPSIVSCAALTRFELKLHAEALVQIEVIAGHRGANQVGVGGGTGRSW